MVAEGLIGLVLANGVRTDHPVPGLPFVDDGCLPLSDPEGIEALGRGRGEGRWGRCDRFGDYWRAFTTDPDYPQLAWVVMAHPEHGRVVYLTRDDDAVDLYSFDAHEGIVIRSGGYWWDGVQWHRPLQRFDWVLERHERPVIDEASTVTASELLIDLPYPPAAPLPPSAFVSGEVSVDAWQWTEQLITVWAQHRPEGSLPAKCCVVDITAPELEMERLLGVHEAARRAGISESTLRAYISRGQSEVPAPQIRVKGRPFWSAPVIQDWVARRQGEGAGLLERVGERDETDGNLRPRGIADLWRRTSETVSARLRLNSRTADEDVAADVAWFSTANPDTLGQILPITALFLSLGSCVKSDLTNEVATGTPPAEIRMTVLSPWTAELLAWGLRMFPERAIHTVQDAVGDCIRAYDLDRAILRAGIRRELSLHLSEADQDLVTILDEALDALPPPT